MEIKRIRDVIGEPFTVRMLCEGYTNDDDGTTTDKVRGYDGKLNIRPAYQRNSVYDARKRDAVIETILENCPLNTMYWVDNEDGTYEVLDGQQRILSICNFVYGKFSVRSRAFPIIANEQDFPNLQMNLSDIAEKLLDYELDVYICKGDPSEKKRWFERININGEPLNDQELLNASHTGAWLNDAKSRFSKADSRGVTLSEINPENSQPEPLLAGSWNRQDYLKTAIEWAANAEGVTPQTYMNNHVNDADASELWQYFSMVIEWVRSKFITYNKALRGLPWGTIYQSYKDGSFEGNIVCKNGLEIQEEIIKMTMDDEITARIKGIYQYIIYGDEKYLHIRQFEEKDMLITYEKQRHHCPYCEKEGIHREYAFSEMQADHIKPWSKGGKTILTNCQMLCKKHNANKGDKW